MIVNGRAALNLSVFTPTADNKGHLAMGDSGPLGLEVPTVRFVFLDFFLLLIASNASQELHNIIGASIGGLLQLLCLSLMQC